MHKQLWSYNVPWRTFYAFTFYFNSGLDILIRFLFNTFFPHLPSIISYIRYKSECHLYPVKALSSTQCAVRDSPHLLLMYLHLSLFVFLSLCLIRLILSASLPSILLLWEPYVVAVNLIEEIGMTNPGVYNEEHWSEQWLQTPSLSLMPHQ